MLKFYEYRWVDISNFDKKRKLHCSLNFITEQVQKSGIINLWPQFASESIFQSNLMVSKTPRWTLLVAQPLHNNEKIHNGIHLFSNTIKVLQKCPTLATCTSHLSTLTGVHEISCSRYICCKWFKETREFQFCKEAKPP